jgi:hypothetical protein
MMRFSILQISGNSFAATLRLVNKNGAPIDLTGSSFELAVRNSASPSPVLMLNTPDELSIDPIAGSIGIVLPVNALPVGSYSAVLTRITGALRETLGTGSITVKQP